MSVCRRAQTSGLAALFFRVRVNDSATTITIPSVAAPALPEASSLRIIITAAATVTGLPCFLDFFESG